MRLRTKLVLGSGGVLVLATLATVAIHLAPVRAMLGWKPLGANGSRSAFCPLGYGAQPERTATAPIVIPTTPRPALGFVLDVTTRAQVTAWAEEHDIECTARRGALECANVPAGAVGGASLALTSVWFRFDRDTLVGIQTVRRSPVVADVVAAFGAVETAMTKVVGDPSRREGVAVADSLSRGALRQAMVEYSAPSYRAVVRATNMGDGYVLTESYAN